VAKVLRALHDDASVSSRTLAVKLGVSTSHLSTAFHEQMGVSLTRYRNRLRIERFFTECDPCGGNLLQAALYAGFGSYPQFHRVFRELLHATPRDYLIPAA
jgi:transcriptional regulator GlxA family with amidase domain